MPHFAPRHAKLLAAIQKIWEANEKANKTTLITIEKLCRATGQPADQIIRIISDIRNMCREDEHKIIKTHPYDGGKYYEINIDYMITRRTTALMFIALKNTNGKSGYNMTREQFINEMLNTVYKTMAQKQDARAEIEIVLNWGLKPEVGHLCIANNSPDHLTTADRFDDERNYIDRVAGVLKETKTKQTRQLKAKTKAGKKAKTKTK